MTSASLLARRAFLSAARASSQNHLPANGTRAASSLVASQQSTYNSGDNASSSSSRLGVLAAAAAASAAVFADRAAAAGGEDGAAAKCCGIAGVVGAKGDAREYLIEGLTILKNRGYDSAGIATMDDKSDSSLVSSPIVVCDVLVISACLVHSAQLCDRIICLLYTMDYENYISL